MRTPKCPLCGKEIKTSTQVFRADKEYVITFTCPVCLCDVKIVDHSFRMIKRLDEF